MTRRQITALFALAIGSSLVLAAEQVSVSGSNARFATRVETKIGDKPVALALTGAGLRTKVFVNVYALASYLDETVKVRTCDELAATDSAKRLHLVMERDVSGKDMADALKVAIRQNYPAPQFNAEVESLVTTMKSADVRQGDQVWLTHVPGIGLHVNLVGKTEMQIKNPKFSKAVWDIYLGKTNLGEALKRSLVGRLR